MTAAQPVIGITTSYTNDSQYVNVNYAYAIEAAGGIPVIAPIFRTEAAAQVFSHMLDGLVITGGPGITEGITGDLPDDLEPVDPIRYNSDRLIYRAFVNRPVLGICYGMQFINAQAGGSIYADLMAQQDNALPHSPKRQGNDHTIRIDPDSNMHQIFQTPEIMVNSYHIQSIITPGDDLRVSARSEDGIIEAIESSDGRLLGVQFHPERMDTMQPLFEAFVSRCHRQGIRP